MERGRLISKPLCDNHSQSLPRLGLRQRCVELLADFGKRLLRPLLLGDRAWRLVMVLLRDWPERSLKLRYALHDEHKRP